MSNLPIVSNQEITQVLAGSIKGDKNPKVLQIIGLGSCIALTFYHPDHQFGAMAHIMLPSSNQARTPEIKGKYADTAVQELIKLFKRKKIPLSKMQIKIIGGSKMFANLNSEIFDISYRNIEAVKCELKKHGLDKQIIGRDTGGTKGRTIYFFLKSGKIQIYFAGGKLKTFV